MFIIQFIRGFCMALADSVPGVSGGTIAFLLGFYDKFIDSIDDLLTGTKEERKDAFCFPDQTWNRMDQWICDRSTDPDKCI